MTSTHEDGYYDGSGKSLDHIEKDIEETRDQIGALLQGIETKLSPRRLIDLASGRVKQTIQGSGFMPAELMARNRVPLILLGAGLGWMLVAGSRPVREPVPSTAYARTRSQGFAPAAQDARARLATLVNDYPLAFGVVGGLLGAALALAVPRERAEQLFDDANERVQQETAGLAGDALHRAAEAASQAAAGAVKESVVELTGDEDTLATPS
jgi:hypothetical protein